jgi:hypothetical protein
VREQAAILGCRGLRTAGFCRAAHDQRDRACTRAQHIAAAS